MLKNLRKILRQGKTQSPIEEMLLNEFNELGLAPMCQYEVYPFFIDLAFPEIQLAIEADGQEYHTKKEHRERDRYRQERLEKLGWRFERFPGWFIKRFSKIAASKIALKYLIDKLDEEGKKKAMNNIAMYFIRSEKDIEFAGRLVDRFLEKLVYEDLPNDFKI
jgi:very-short-patch-repair endonuclease